MRNGHENEWSNVIETIHAKCVVRKCDRDRCSEKLKAALFGFLEQRSQPTSSTELRERCGVPDHW
jgi:hypothetical protein